MPHPPYGKWLDDGRHSRAKESHPGLAFYGAVLAVMLSSGVFMGVLIYRVGEWVVQLWNSVAHVIGK